MFEKKKLIHQYAEEAQIYSEKEYADYLERHNWKPDYTEQEENDSKPRYSIDLDSDAYSNIDYMRWFNESFIKFFSEEIEAKKEKTFVEGMLSIIDSNQLKDSAVYKAAGIDRRLYSKIISDKDYKPSKDTCIAICFALQLPEYDFRVLLARAGYCLSESIKRDLILEFFLRKGFYEIDTINEVLKALGYKPLNR